MIKLIIFDLWQTLAFRDVSYSTTQKILEETGVDLSRGKFLKVFERSIQTKKWLSKYGAYKNLCKNMGLPTTKQNINHLMNIRDKAEAKIKLYPFTIPLLKQLKKQGYKIGIVSNSSVFVIEIIKKKTCLMDYVDYPLFSFDVGAIKPDLKIFKAMLKISGCNPGEVQLKKDFADLGILVKIP